MTMLLRLDTPAVQRLIADNPEFELELTQACVAEIARRITTVNLKEIVEAAQPAAMKALKDGAAEANWLRELLDAELGKMFERQSNWGKPSTWKPTKETMAKLASLVEAAKLDIVREAANALTPLITTAVEARRTELEAKVEARVANIQNRMVEEEVDRRVKARMAAIFDATKDAV